MRILCVADSQVDERSRLEEHDRVMAFLCHRARETEPVAILHAGDVYERRATEIERRSVYDWIDDCLPAAVVIAAGNHDAIGEVDEVERWFYFDGGSAGVFAREVPDVIDLGPRGPIVAVLPWPRRAELVRYLERSGTKPTAEETDAAGVALVRDVLRGLRAELDSRAAPDQPRILLAHLDVVEHKVGADQPSRSSGIRIGVDDLLLAGCDAVILGHVHRHQSWELVREDGAIVPVVYCGSPRRTAYSSGDAEVKGIVELTFNGRTPSWSLIPTPATPMLLVEARYVVEETLTGSRGVLVGAEVTDDVTGAEIRLRYSVRPEHREEARHAAEEWANRARARGAAQVVTDEAPVPTARARAPEVAAAPTVAEKVRVVLASRGVPQERIERVAALAREIEEVVS